MRIAVGTTNQAKVQAVKNVFQYDYEIVNGKVPSGVSEQPFSDEETIQGAINRAKASIEKFSADLGIGLEGGVTETSFGLMLCNWAVLVKRDEPESPIIAGGSRILLPEEISDRLRNGEELGPVMDEYCGETNIGAHEGAIGVFTNGRINREQMFTHIVEMLRGQLEYKAFLKGHSNHPS